MEKYLVYDQNNKLILTEDELLKFVKVAVIQNKDISSFSVQRVSSIPASHLSKESARIRVVEAAFFRVFNL